MQTTLRLHLICSERRGVIHGDGQFVTGAWAIPLWKARRVGIVHLHQNQNSAPYLTGRVDELWMSPDNGRVAFHATETDEPTPAVTKWGQWAAYAPLHHPNDPALAALIVRLGFVVAAADGLSHEEHEALEDFATERSGLDKDSVRLERENAEGGLASFTEADLARVRTVQPETLAGLIEDIKLAASADGDFSAAERDVMVNFMRRLHQEETGASGLVTRKGGA